MKKLFFFFSLAVLSSVAFSQTIKMLSGDRKNSLRGLSVVSDNVIWVSGSNGTVGLSKDGGLVWQWMTVTGFERSDFRDVEAFDAKTAVIMAVDEPAYILRTTDAGASWKVVYKNEGKGMFLDAMEFWNEQAGIVVGDPINNRFFISRTFDAGKSWQDMPYNKRPVADSGEACFASSGTNVVKLNKAEAVFVSGGLSSHLFLRDKKILLPVLQGTQSTGANSVAVKNSSCIMIAGGDFNIRDSSAKNCFYTTDAGVTWQEPAQRPGGYRSCIQYLSGKKWITCGLNGVDLSTDDGKNFISISKEGFHVCKKAKKGSAVFFAGSNGRIGKLDMESRINAQKK